MMSSNDTAVPVRALARAWETLTGTTRRAGGRTGLAMFLESDAAFETWMHVELADFVIFVDDPREADVRVRVTPVAGHGGIRHYQIDFVGTGTFESIEASTRLHLPDLRAARAASVENELVRGRVTAGPRHTAVM